MMIMQMFTFYFYREIYHRNVIQQCGCDDDSCLSEIRKRDTAIFVLCTCARVCIYQDRSIPTPFISAQHCRSVSFIVHFRFCECIRQFSFDFGGDDWLIDIWIYSIKIRRPEIRLINIFVDRRMNVIGYDQGKTWLSWASNPRKQNCCSSLFAICQSSCWWRWYLL